MINKSIILCVTESGALKNHVLPLNNKPFLLGFPEGPESLDTSHQAGAPFSPKEIQVDKTYDVMEEI